MGWAAGAYAVCVAFKVVALAACFSGSGGARRRRLVVHARGLWGQHNIGGLVDCLVRWLVARFGNSAPEANTCGWGGPGGCLAVWLAVRCLYSALVASMFLAALAAACVSALEACMFRRTWCLPDVVALRA